MIIAPKSGRYPLASLWRAAHVCAFCGLLSGSMAADSRGNTDREVGWPKMSTNSSSSSNLATPSASPAKTAITPSITTTPGASLGKSTEPLDDKHKLAIGDRLSFRIEEDLEDPKPLMVTDSGDLEVPYIGRVPAEAKTCKQLAAEIKTALEKEYYYQATVVLAVDQMAKSRGKVYIVGPVRTPGPQEIPSDEILTLSKAILRAGGFNEFADRHNVKVTRRPVARGKQILVVDVAQIFDKGRVELDLPLEPGDLILVPERLVRF